MEDIDNIKYQVEKIIADYCQKNLSEAIKIGKGYERLWQEISSYLATGGKRIRPLLIINLYLSYGGKDMDKILPIAGAWELLHASLLVHDDIIDRDLVRHGHPNIAGQYENHYKSITKNAYQHYALSSSLLAGDLLLTSGYDLVNQSGLSDTDKVKASNYIRRAVYEVGGGELIDVESVLYPIEQSDPLTIAEYKTASYSFILPMMLGADLAGASDAELNKLLNLGTNLGIAFQLQDDLLGVFGRSEQTGKSNRSDIVEKKRTLLMKLAYRELNTAAQEKLDQLFHVDHNLTHKEVEDVVNLIKQTSAIKNVKILIDEHVNKAKDMLAELNIDDKKRGYLESMINDLAIRSV